MNWILYPLKKAILKFTICFIIFFTTTGIIQAQTFNFFGGSTAGAITDNDGLGAKVVGLRFTVGQPGNITTLSFFNGSGINQTYTVSLWIETANVPGGSGTLLTSGTFTGTPSAVAWTTVNTPDAHISPGNVYVVSVHAPSGDYGVTAGGLPTSDQGIPVSGPPYALILIGASTSTAATPNNAIYADGVAATGYPGTAESPANNLMVDVSFTTDFPLPVTLTNLKATPENKNVAISWQTQSEQNNKGFEIQRSNNNEDWYSIGFVNGAGNSSSTLNYSFIDKEPAPGKYFYRLQQVDLDNRSKLSSTVSATISGKGKTALFQNSPNPVKSTTLIRFDLPDRQQVRLSVVDMSGREVQTLVNKTADQGSHVITLNAASLSKQLYIIRLQTETEIITKQMLVQ